METIEIHLLTGRRAGYSRFGLRFLPMFYPGNFRPLNSGPETRFRNGTRCLLKSRQQRICACRCQIKRKSRQLWRLFFFVAGTGLEPVSATWRIWARRAFLRRNKVSDEFATLSRFKLFLSGHSSRLGFMGFSVNDNPRSEFWGEAVFLQVIVSK